MNLDELKQLTSSQYDMARESAVKRIIKRIGDKPTRSQFQREYGALISSLDIIALAVFLAALVVSSTHIIQLMANEAAASYKSADVGVYIDEHWYTLIHQLGLIALAELSVILFLVMHNMRTDERASRSVFTRHLSIFGFMALASATFVFAANFASGINPFIAFLPPLMTLGIGYRLEGVITERMKRSREIDDKYTSALAIWESASEDPKTHPDYPAVLRTEIWEKLVSLKANAAFKDAPSGFKFAAVYREQERERWAYDHVPFEAVTPGYGTASTHGSSSEMSAIVQVENASIPAMQNGNGHTG